MARVRMVRSAVEADTDARVATLNAGREYDVEDGLADALVRAGHAERLEGEPVRETATSRAPAARRTRRVVKPTERR